MLAHRVVVHHAREGGLDRRLGHPRERHERAFAETRASLALDAKNAERSRRPPTKMIASALPATSAVIAHKSSEHPMTTNKSGAVKSFHSVFMKAHAFANASSRPSRRHAHAT